MKVTFLTILFSLLIMSSTYGQKERYLTFEAGGVGGLMSFN